MMYSVRLRHELERFSTLHVCVSGVRSVAESGWVHEASNPGGRYALTKNQRDRVERIARDPAVTGLYREQSMSGISETLRYRRQFVERTPWGNRLRRESHMVLSVTIRLLPDGSDDPESLTKYNALCEQAESLFQELRQQ